MAKLALIGQAQYGNTKKIAHELAKAGWNVEIFDASKPSQFKHGRMPTGFDLLLLIAGHIPGGLNQRFKDTCRAAKQRFLETSPDWSGTAVLLSKYGLLPAPSVIPNLATSISVAPQPEVFTTPSGILTHKPMADLAKKMEEEKKAQAMAKAEEKKQEPPKVQMVPVMPKEEPVPKNGEAKDGEKYKTWVKTTTSDGTPSKLVNPYIASRIEKSAAASQVALTMLKEGGLASIPIGDGYDKFVEAQSKAGGHIIGDSIWRRLRRKVRIEMGLSDDTAWWAGKIHGASTPSDRRFIAKKLIKEHPEWTAIRIIDEVREQCGIGVEDDWVRKELDKARKAAKKEEAQVAKTQQPAPEPSDAAVKAVKLLETATQRAEAMAVAKVALEAVPAKLAVPVSKEDERRAAIQLLKEALVDSDVEELIFRRQADGSYTVKGREVERRVKETEY